ncbi:hypothetical protein [Dactylosporangium matsuzakiense]|uniref:Predicted hydrolase N-terminal domain-containing protein n=1 Tax=Dactylosporangium matsuzakiense TaxID=53360 RepID=A0A9W6KVQ4_9ACTN|nr:hypothetical protein [Dactylosporangium matsuzakiense]UWZ42443.1 hypothetical protein Dmats_33430 [Dactylosporangium matsuzakiense]GLL08055.1 hypothetical protein GCM10017581_098150 [Dactylosporangium matsuzakiense]
MADFSQESLVAAAGVDPWKLQAKFAAGDPEEIYAMAKGFNQAAAQQGDAVTLATKGLETAGDGYKVNNATPIDVNAQVAEASKSLGNKGENLGKIARLLSETASDLSQRTATANTQIQTLVSDVNGIIGEWNQEVRRMHNLPEFQQDRQSFMKPYLDRAVQKVKDAGVPLTKSIADYEKYLADHLKSMADLGYIPPNALDEGPGDVDVPDPTAAANGTVAATKLTDPNAAKAAFAQNTQYLDLLNKKAKAGVALSEAEKNWLKGYYEAVTPHFGEIKDWADKTAGVKPGEKPNQKDPFVQMVSRVGDGFLNLSQNVPYDELPKSARDIIASNLGVTDAANQAGFFATPGERHLPEPWPPKTDPALLAAAGFTGLLNDYSSDDVKPSADLASHLKDSSLRWKHQINVMYANYKADYPIAKAYGYGGPELSEADFNKLMPDELSSDALGVVARNRDYTNSWIVNNAAERREVMGMNWQSGQGAADVIVSATLRGHGLDDTRAAQAGLAIVQDAATDYDGLAKMANTQVKGAIANVGVFYLDSFANYDTGPNHVQTITLPNGQTISGFQMDDATRGNFLKFVAASDKDIYTHFREATLTRGSDYLQMAMAAGHTDPHDPEYVKAMNNAVRLNAMTDGAAAGVLLDMAHDGASDDQRKKMAEDLAYAQQMSDYEVKQGYIKAVSTVFDLAGLVTLPTGVGTALDVGSTAFGMITDAAIQEPKAPDQNTYLTNLQGYISDLSKAQSADAAAHARATDNMVAMTIDANARAGHPITYTDASGNVVQVRMDSDGQYPESVVQDIYNSQQPYTQQLGGHTIDQLIGGTESNTDQHGGGSQAQFSQSASGTQPLQVGSLSDSGGNWTNSDDQYRIYYGDETRFQYHEPTQWDGAYVDKQVPDNKGDSKTTEPLIPGAK